MELPAYFAKINKSPSYQLTAVGAAMPRLHVAEEIDETALEIGATIATEMNAPVCSFRIAGGAVILFLHFPFTTPLGLNYKMIFA